LEKKARRNILKKSKEVLIEKRDKTEDILEALYLDFLLQEKRLEEVLNIDNHYPIDIQISDRKITGSFEAPKMNGLVGSLTVTYAYYANARVGKTYNFLVPSLHGDRSVTVSMVSGSVAFVGDVGSYGTAQDWENSMKVFSSIAKAMIMVIESGKGAVMSFSAAGYQSNVADVDDRNRAEGGKRRKRVYDMMCKELEKKGHCHYTTKKTAVSANDFEIISTKRIKEVAIKLKDLLNQVVGSFGKDVNKSILKNPRTIDLRSLLRKS
jgi:hypothetical protein